MTRSTANIFSAAIWILSIILVSAGLVFFYRFSREVDGLRRERSRIIFQLNAARSERDNLASNSILLKNSLVAYQGYIGKTARILNGNCASEWNVRCRRYLRYGDLLSYHSVTLVTRIAAGDPGGYRTLLARYGGTFRLIDAVNWYDPGEGRQWTAIANEGVAYAYWKLGRPDLAQRPIEASLRAMGGSSIVVATDLKIKCALKTPAERVRRQFTDFRTSFGARIGALERKGASEQRESAIYNLDLFDDDVELRRVCAYADLPSATHEESGTP